MKNRCWELLVVGLYAISLAACSKRTSPGIGSREEGIRSEPTTSALGASDESFVSAGAARDAGQVDSASPQDAGANCVVSLTTSDTVEFTECRNPPRFITQPDCYDYQLGSVPSTFKGRDENGCLPGLASLTIAGPNDITIVVVEGVAAGKQVIQLRLVQTIVARRGFDVAPGTVLGTLDLVKGKVTKLRFGPGLKSKTGVRELKGYYEKY